MMFTPDSPVVRVYRKQFGSMPNRLWHLRNCDNCGKKIAHHEWVNINTSSKVVGCSEFIDIEIVGGPEDGTVVRTKSGVFEIPDSLKPYRKEFEVRYRPDGRAFVNWFDGQEWDGVIHGSD